MSLIVSSFLSLSLSLSLLRSMDAFSLGRIQVDEPAVDGQMGEIKSKYSHSLILIQQMLIACFCPCTFFHSPRFSTRFLLDHSLDRRLLQQLQAPKLDSRVCIRCFCMVTLWPGKGTRPKG